ncbi:MAG: alpha/beta hydrolase [Spirochaetaceae bacterium]|nr:MAG: alpha/beta hydrolase [Spirochaetaceae bacterium]
MERVSYPRAGLTSTGQPFVELREGEPRLFVFDGLPVHNTVPEGLMLQGVADAYREYARAYSVVVFFPPIANAVGLTIPEVARIYVDSMKEFGPEPAHVIGVAYGGMVALAAAALFPDAIDRLAVVTAAYRLGADARAAIPGWIDLARERRWRDLHRAMSEAIRTGVVSRGFFGTISWLFPGLLGTPDDAEQFIGALESLAACDVSSQLPAIRAATLVLGGDRDFYYPEDEIRVTADKIARSELRIFEKTGHDAVKTRAEEIETAVLEFLARES